jgi:hypothetical protein
MSSSSSGDEREFPLDRTAAVKQPSGAGRLRSKVPSTEPLRNQKQSKAWMTGLWNEWCSELNSFYCGQKRTVWLVSDTCPAHTVPDAAMEVQWTAQTVREHIRNDRAGTTLTTEGEEPSLRGFIMSNLCVIFLPANTTLHIQPMDQGIIAALKAHYRTSAHGSLFNRFFHQPFFQS